MKRLIKFRGVEFFSKKFIYGQTIRETDDGFDIWTGDDWLHCTDLAQLVGYDSDGREVYEGDELVGANGFEFKARFVGNLTDGDKLSSKTATYCSEKLGKPAWN